MNGIDAAQIREDPFPPDAALPPEAPDPNETEPEENANAPASSLPAGEPEGPEPPAFPDEPERAKLPDEPDPAAYPDEPDPVITGPLPSPGRIRPGLAWLRTAVPWALAVLASFVFAASALTAVKEAEISREKVGRFLLGAVFGGRENVTVILPEPIPGEPVGPLSGGDATTETEGIPAPQDPLRTVSDEPDAQIGIEEDPAMDAAVLLQAEEALPPDGEKSPEEEELPAGDAGQPLFLFPADPYLANETEYRPDPAELLSLPRAVPTLDELRERWGPDAPFVLILHTHGTEAFAECADSGWRSLDPSLSVVALGERLAEKLREADIPTIHLTDCFDDPDFNMAYTNAALAIREALTLAPSVSYILDIHRDSVTLPDGTAYAPVTEADGVPAARLMFVVGTDEAGADHPGWRNNLALALRLQTALSARYPALMRDVNLRSASFNEQYSKGSLLIEAGAAGCTLKEAMTAVDLLSDALIAEIRGDE